MRASSLFFIFLTGCTLLQPRPRELTLRKSWVRQTNVETNKGYRMSHQMSPILYEDMIIQGNAIDGIAAFHRIKGHRIWRFPIKNGVSSGAEISDGKLYFGGSDGHFYCLDALTGKLVWTFPTRVENLAPPLVEDGTVYFLSGNDTLYALNASSGQQKWVYVRAGTTEISIRGGTKPALFQNTLYVGFADGYLVAIHSRDGTIAWERQINTNLRFRDIDASPIIDGSSIYVSGFDNALYSLSRQSGQIQWRVEGGSSFPATINGDRLFYSTSTGEVRALHKITGKILWEKKLASGLATQPVVYKELLVYGESQGPLKVVRAEDGGEVLNYSSGIGVNSTPLSDAKNNRVYFMSHQGNLYSMLLQFDRVEPMTRLRAADL